MLADWAATVPALLAARHALGPVSDPADPFTVVATLTRGALHAGAGGEPLPAPTLAPLRTALGDLAATLDQTPVTERAGQLATLTQLGYRLTHWAQARVPHAHPSHAWLQTAETVLDGAVHAPAPRTPLARSLAGWQQALAEIQGRPELLFRRGATAGHLRLLTTAQDSLDYATRHGLLPAGYGEAVGDALRHLARAHQATLDTPTGPPEPPSRADQLLLLHLGRTVADLTRRPTTPDDLARRLDALLRTAIGHAPLVAALSGRPAAQRAADQLQRLTLDYLNHPHLLTPPDRRRPGPTREPVPATPPPPPRPADPLPATIANGTVLDRAAVATLCRARDLGRAAATADPTQPPELLRGTDPATWPALAQAGRQAITDLVASVTPMVYAQTRYGPNLDDVRGELFIALTQAAHLYDPDRVGGVAWSSYAWRTLQCRRWTKTDSFGVPHTRNTPPTTRLGQRDLIDPTPSPEDTAVAPDSYAAVTAAVANLPGYLKAPLEASLTGQPTRFIAEDLHVSASTIHRRLNAARAILRTQLTDPDLLPPPRLWETVTATPSSPPDPSTPAQPARPAPPR